ncbi:hypothetical protein F8M41_007152 [Gigaspora margarita]|uniref:Uncharacterized protein n=1 Tax=Gigaspora margarita TaxID=4874 RepID=A0A8H4AWE5_GIGMA|nr:hypothetical protein F8M41_007152 [Gigaspora margarita]
MRFIDEEELTLYFRKYKKSANYERFLLSCRGDTLLGTFQAETVTWEEVDRKRYGFSLNLPNGENTSTNDFDSPVEIQHIRQSPNQSRINFGDICAILALSILSYYAEANSSYFQRCCIFGIFRNTSTDDETQQNRPPPNQSDFDSGSQQDLPSDSNSESSSGLKRRLRSQGGSGSSKSS